MKVTMLLAQCTPTYLTDSISIIKKVFSELDVEVESVDLAKLPYFNNKRVREMDEIVHKIEKSKGVIAITNVPMLSVHGAMQTFFDSATLYKTEQFDKPILAITYSEWLGEVEAAEKMLKMWNVLGGNEGNKLGINKAMNFDDIRNRLERMSEDFYRVMKQDRGHFDSTERQLYHFLRRGHSLVQDYASEFSAVEPKVQEPEIKSFVDIIKSQSLTSQDEKMVSTEPENLSTKEQTIKEITSLLKKQVSKDEIKEESKEFVAMNTGVYKKPVAPGMPNGVVRYLQQIPHYFIAQHDKETNMIIRYNITDEAETGFIIVKNGDCIYKENLEEGPVVDLTLTKETLLAILKKRMTYQKAFMLGKLKVKGNFALLPRLDQIFDAM